MIGWIIFIAISLVLLAINPLLALLPTVIVLLIIWYGDRNSW